jgi:DNA-binding LytR/AlgR family response regulator
LYRTNHYKYLVKQKDKTHVLEISDIHYIESSGRHIVVVTEKNQYDCVGKISDEEKKLGGYNFVKCHQGYLVNVVYIKVIESNIILLTSGKEIPLSRHFRVNVKNVFCKYILGCTV